MLSSPECQTQASWPLSLTAVATITRPRLMFPHLETCYSEGHLLPVLFCPSSTLSPLLLPFRCSRCGGGREWKFCSALMVNQVQPGWKKVLAFCRRSLHFDLQVKVSFLLPICDLPPRTALPPVCWSQPRVRPWPPLVFWSVVVICRADWLVCCKPLRMKGQFPIAKCLFTFCDFEKLEKKKKKQKATGWRECGFRNEQQFVCGVKSFFCVYLVCVYACKRKFSPVSKQRWGWWGGDGGGLTDL